MCFQVDSFLYLDGSLELYSEDSKDCLKFFLPQNVRFFCLTFWGIFLLNFSD